MKVEGPQATRISGTRRKSGVSSDESFADALTESEAPTSSSSLTAPANTTPVGSLLALQGAEADIGDAAAERAKARGEAILRQLDQLRMDILLGAIPRPHLFALAQGVKTLRLQVFDPRLTDILDEIDLRAQVELAKYDPYR